jgi:hypothetical protein
MLKSKLSFLTEYGIEFGSMFGVQGTSFVAVWVVFTLLLVVFTKNSIQLMNNLKQNTFYALITAFLFVVALYDMNKISEFLYFNF